MHLEILVCEKLTETYVAVIHECVSIMFFLE